MKPGFVYFMSNRRDGVLYVGVTSDLIRRCYEHQNELVDGFTKQYGLKRLIYFEAFDDIRLTIQREKAIKHWPRAWKVRLMNGANREWNDLSAELQQDVDGRDKPGHDSDRVCVQRRSTANWIATDPTRPASPATLPLRGRDRKN